MQRDQRRVARQEADEGRLDVGAEGVVREGEGVEAGELEDGGDEGVEGGRDFGGGAAGEGVGDVEVFEGGECVEGGGEGVGGPDGEGGAGEGDGSGGGEEGEGEGVGFDVGGCVEGDERVRCEVVRLQAVLREGRGIDARVSWASRSEDIADDAWAVLRHDARNGAVEYGLSRRSDSLPLRG